MSDTVACAISTAHVIHPELVQLFDEHSEPQHASKRDAHDLIGPVLDVVAKAQQQVAAYRRLLYAAETAPHNPVVDAKLEQLAANLGGLEHKLSVLGQDAREVAKGFTQVDLVLQNARIDLTIHAQHNPPCE